MNVDVIVGLQWGDEGKGKMIDVLSTRYDIIARYQGGPNAGHTIVFDDKEIVLHTLPSGFCRPHCTNLIGNGVVINPVLLKEEIEMLIDRLEISLEEVKKRLIISNKAHLILPTHVLLDEYYEKGIHKKKIGSTLCGIGPCYTDKVARKGLQLGHIYHSDFREQAQKNVADHSSQMHIDASQVALDEWLSAAEWLRQFQITTTELYIHESINAGKKILAEGAQGAMLDINFGTYPYVTSSSTTTAGVCLGLGIPPQKIGKVYGVTKAYTTRVGEGPFPTELFGEEGKLLQDKGHEYGATTGRPRRCGWLDMPLLRYANMINGVTCLMLMKLDVLADMPSIKIASHYVHKQGEKLLAGTNEDFFDKASPAYKKMDTFPFKEPFIEQPALKTYIAYIEEQTKIPVSYVSYGPNRSQIWSKKI